MTNVLSRIMSFIVILAALTSASVSAGVNEDRAEVRAATQKVLSTLYQAQPSARRVVEGAAAHAVFSNFGMKIFFAGGGGGNGIAVSHKTKKEIFMKMLEVQAGLGLGVKKFGVIFVFENEAPFNKFIESGWEFGGQATAAAKYGDKGAAYQGAVSVAPGVWMYQVTEDGLAFELTAKGTKYYKNDKLN